MDGLVKDRHYGIGRVYYRRRGFKQSVRFSRKLNKRAHEYKKGSVHAKENLHRGFTAGEPMETIPHALMALGGGKESVRYHFFTGWGARFHLLATIFRLSLLTRLTRRGKKEERKTEPGESERRRKRKGVLVPRREMQKSGCWQ